MEAGQGMGACLTLASERRAYVVADRSTLTVLADVLDLEVLAEDGPALENLYSVIETTAGVNPNGAARLRDWLLGERALGLIRVSLLEKSLPPVRILVDINLDWFVGDG